MTELWLRVHSRRLLFVGDTPLSDASIVVPTIGDNNPGNARNLTEALKASGDERAYFAAEEVPYHIQPLGFQ